MQIPESINKLTTEVSPSLLTPKVVLPTLDLDELVYLIRKSLTSKELTNFELGLAYFKSDVSNEKQVIKNFVNVLTEGLVTAIKESSVNEDEKSKVAFNTKQFCNTLEQSFENLYNLLFIFNKEKNFLEPKQVTLIILGYALSIIKKIHNG